MAENTGSAAPGAPATSAQPSPQPQPPTSGAPARGPLVVGRTLHYRNKEGVCEPAIVIREEYDEVGPGVVAYNAAEGWRPRWDLEQDPTKPDAAHWPADCPKARSSPTH